MLGNAFEGARRPKYQRDVTQAQLQQYGAVFGHGFWPPDVGSKSATPIFVVGMMRSGSTLVESILSSHSKVWGAGEDSVFNGNLPAVRDGVVAAVATGKVSVLKKAVDRFAAEVEKGMYAKVPAAERRNVKFIVDKMLFNYRNIGFIHLLCKDGYAHLPN